MDRVRINTSKPYDVCIGNGILKDCALLVKEIKKPCSVAIITDSNVNELYSDTVKKSFEQNGFRTVKFVFKAGENSKNICVFSDILEFLAENQITRTDIIVALGGGVVGDISGFAAACYLRGIDFIQIPTSLLACVDSSVGGKTAIDLNHGKNLAGIFHQPALVICDTDVLKTLPKEEIACGFAEIIKYAVCFDSEFFDLLEKEAFDIGYVITKCVKFKRDVVILDEFDNGKRKLLNFGHTAAHSIEKHSLYSLNHGQAVAVGMVIASKIAILLGMFDNVSLDRLIKVLEKYSLPTTYEIDVNSLIDGALSDKKRESNKITLILPKRLGECLEIEKDISELENLFSYGLS